jgi:hypothetical protein
MQRSMTTYVKSLSKRAEGEDKEKTLPGGHLGSVMVTHSEDFEPDSEFGNSLQGSFGPDAHSVIAKCSSYRKGERAAGPRSGNLCGQCYVDMVGKH